MGACGNRGSNQSIDHANTFSRLQLRLTEPNQITEREFESATEENLYFSHDHTDTSSGNWGRRAGKKWKVFILGCFDLGCSSLAILIDGRTLISILVYGNGSFLITTATCSLILSFCWFLAAWKLLESAYLRKRIIERYQLARFWRASNVALLIVFILSSILTSFCLYGKCEFGSGTNEMQFVKTTAFRVSFYFAVILTCCQRVISIWYINKYINELYSELSVDSLPLQVL